MAKTENSRPTAKAAPKTKPATKKLAATKPAARAGKLDAMTITVKAKENPYMGGRGERFALLRTGMTVAEYVAAGERKGHKRGRLVGGLRLFERDEHLTLTAAR